MLQHFLGCDTIEWVCAGSVLTREPFEALQFTYVTAFAIVLCRRLPDQVRRSGAGGGPGPASAAWAGPRMGLDPVHDGRCLAGLHSVSSRQLATIPRRHGRMGLRDRPAVSVPREELSARARRPCPCVQDPSSGPSARDPARTRPVPDAWSSGWACVFVQVLFQM